PAAGTAPTPLPRELILLIDHSGSMCGPKWQAADWAVQNLLAGVSPADTFNLGLFHHETRWFSRSPIRGDERTVRQARDFLLAHHDSGGTELGVALEQALGQQRDTDKRSRHVVIVTDAQVSDAGRILALAEREAGQSERRRVDVLCIDAAPNAGLAAELAERGGGLARFLTSDPTENDIASALDEILADWSAPVLRNLALEIDSPSVQAAGRQVRTRGQERSTIDLGDLPAGRAIWVAGRIEEALASGAPVSLVADGVTIAEASAHDDAGTEDRPPVAALFGARRVLDIELAQTSGISLETRLRQLGYDPGKELSGASAAGASPIYAENARQQSSDALKGLLVREALRYGIVCSATAFVATRQEAGEQIAGTVDVANALAHGWSDDFLMARHAVGGAPTMFRAAAPMPASFAPPAAESTGDLRMSRNLHQLEPWDDTSAPPPAPGAGSGFGLGGLAEAPLEAARNLARRLRKSGHANEAARPTSPSGVTVFSGTPAFTDGEAVLFDSQFDPERLSGLNRLSRLLVHTNQGGDTDSGLVIALYVDDLAAPRARVRLEDVLRQGGERPLNIRLQTGQRVRLLLLDAAGAWAASAPALEVRLG
ncbi:MAG: VWA domain-containing protein, partial [Chloroflexota bacterium]